MRDRTSDQINIVLIRHGATRSNLEHRYLGKTDESLCEQGVQILTEDIEKGRYPKVDLLFTSPMRRCIETAQIIYPGQDNIVIEEFSETDFGLFEGKNYEDLNGNEDYQKWIDSGGMLPFPEGESRKSYSDRCARGFEKMLRHIYDRMDCERRKSCTVGCVVHGGTIMSLGERYAGGEYYDFQVSAGGGYEGYLIAENGIAYLKLERKI